MRLHVLALHLTVILLMLPWGAFGQRHAMPGAAPATPAVVAERAQAPAVASAVATAATSAAVPTVTKVAQVRRCHGPALPGAPCGLFLPPAAVAPPLPYLAARRIGPDAAARAPRDPALSPPRRPPRLA
ncbi:hypothetical protein [Frigidibacter sp. MR17.24]|uniref:hypothetical protein n=1 Tax=Frigidibacter sp. MR17.24 TaxID=3127345 RepID=UPI003012B452